MPEMMTVHEVADYLRIKERKIYDLLTQKQIPCVRVTGKWLFPKYLIDLWLQHNSENQLASTYLQKIPDIAAGSHDPLLEWALREVEPSLAMQTTGSLEGLSRFAAGEAMLCGMHVLDNISGEYNIPFIKTALQGQDIVVLTWAWRQQGLVVSSGNPLQLNSLSDLIARKARVIDRQAGAGTQILFSHLLAQANLDFKQVNILTTPARTQMDVGLAIANHSADAGIGIAAVAKQLHLDFIPLIRERFDLVMRRRDFFQPPIQALFKFIRTPTFLEKAQQLRGYDLTELGQVVFNP